MGLLDDAIREHLDLKRRRGADPGEVDQLEREALGPVRRGPQISDEPLPDEAHVEHDEHFDHEEHDERLNHEEPFDHHGPFGADEPFDEQPPPEHQGPATVLYDEEADAPPPRAARTAPPEPEFADEPDKPAAGEERGWSFDSAEDWEDEEPVEPADSAPPRDETADAPTSEHAAPPEPPAQASGPTPPPEPGAEHAGQETVEYDVEAEQHREQEDDVLEETPEFLQDTPDHDRLWFEQKPPRPFDFDK
jgi:hypothetical protein